MPPPAAPFTPPSAAAVAVAAAALALAVTIAACASTPELTPSDPCGADEAFERGLADGEAGRAQELGWTAAACGGARESDAIAAYRQGHAAGEAARASDRGAEPRGAGGGAGGGGWRCEIQARGDPFHGEGPTREAAAAAAASRCRERNGERYCREASCRLRE